MTVGQPPGALPLLLIAGLVLTGSAAFVVLQQPVPVPAFAEMSVEHKKHAFFDYLRPHVLAANADVLAERRRIGELKVAMARHPDGAPGWWDRRYLTGVAERFDFELDPHDLQASLDALLLRVDIVPASLVLIQAAKESGWGTSRFAREGYNFFGQQCFEPGCGFTPLRRDPGKTHEVARFGSPSQAVRAYLHNLNTHYRYAEFRRLREAARHDGVPLQGTALAAGLGAYSERGDAYVLEVVAMIRQNGLE